MNIKELLCSQLSPKMARSEISLNVSCTEISPIVFDSKILDMKKGYAEILNSFLCQERKVQRVERLFRASEHGFSAKVFHQKCDKQEDTLVLVHTEFGKTIGGYTHYPWTSPDSW